MQRFKSKADLVRSTLSYAWDGLDEKTAAFSAKVPKTPAGAVQLLTMLSKDYGEIEAYADALLILREDLRDPALRARGAKWKAVLTRALEECFDATPHAPRGIGLLMASQWQGSLLWWSFDPKGPGRRACRGQSPELRVGDHGRAAPETSVEEQAGMMRALAIRPRFDDNLRAID